MNKNIPLIVTVLFMAIISFYIAEPAAAVNVVDHFVKYQTDSQYGDIKMVTTTYQYSNNYLKIKTEVYKKSGNNYIFWENWWASLTKVSNTKLKINNWPTIDGPNVDTHYVTTSLTAAQYYWRVYKAQIM
jgi:hypothetical protein